MSLMLYAAMGAATVPPASDPAFDPSAFVFTIRIDNDGDSFTWPGRSGTYDATFNWGDGSSDHVTAAPSAHVYASAGDYDVTVTGACPAPHFAGRDDRSKIIDVKQWGSLVGANDWGAAFSGCNNMAVTATDPFGSGVTKTAQMFYSASSANPFASNWDMSGVTKENMQAMFALATVFDQDLSGWCVSHIDSEPQGFALASGLQPQHYPVWGTCP